MRRDLVRITIALLLGALTTVGVACGFARFGSAHEYVAGSVDPETVGWSLNSRAMSQSIAAADEPSLEQRERLLKLHGELKKHREASPASETFHLVEIARLPGVGVEWIASSSREFELDRSSPDRLLRLPRLGSEAIVLCRCGFPFASLEKELVVHAGREDPQVESAVHHLVNVHREYDLGDIREIVNHVREGGGFALRPLLPGFILNTLFYTAIWLTIFFGISAARCAIRRMRRQCVMCGYDLRGMLGSGCPECGWGRD